MNGEEIAARLRLIVAGLGDESKTAEVAVDDDDDEGEETLEGDDEAAVAVPFESPTTAVTRRNIFQHPDAHPIALDLALLSRYGPEWLEWEPETLVHVVPRHFGVAGISDVNLHKLQAIKTLHFTERFWLDWEVFGWCCAALNGVPPDFQKIQPPTITQALIAVDASMRVRTDVSWSEELLEYLHQLHVFRGFMCPVAPLDFVKVDHEYYAVDCARINAAWPEVRKSGKAPAGDGVEDEQLRRMLDAHSALEESRSELRAQIPLVSHDRP